MYCFYITENMKSIVTMLCLSKLVMAWQDTGFPAGLMADCPGMTKNTTLSEKTRESLTVVVLWPSSGWLGNKEETCKLSPEGTHCVAKHLDLKKRKTLVFISGYLDASFSPIARALATPYLDRGRNVILVEIYPILHRSYPIAARLTKPLGSLVGEFLAELTHRGLSPHKLELLGGSLGAHIASFAAAKFHEITDWKPARLTGLDPAGPCFRNLPRSERFNSDSARKVDAVHTNIDGFGIPDADAHIDFYVNGGESQTSMMGGYLMPCFHLCSHVRSAIYWIIAHFRPHEFLAVKCKSVFHARHGMCYRGHEIVSNALGPKTNFSKPGIYYLPTLASMPYHMGHQGLTERKYGVNHYLLKITPDEDMVI